MSLYKSRSGGSLFRFKAVSGYLKVLLKRNQGVNERLLNTMKAKYKISEE